MHRSPHRSLHLRRPRASLVAVVVALLALLANASTATAALRVGVVGPNVLVRPADAPATADVARMVAAGNEFESVQVVMRAEEGSIAGVDVQVTGALAGPGGTTIPGAALTVYRVGYYDVAGHPSDGDLGGALGMFPDSLVPRVDRIWDEPRRAFPVDVPAGQNRLAWIDLHVPHGTPAGRYAGARIRVTAGGSLVGSVDLEVDVLGFDLPSTTSLDGGFDVNPNRICAAHACSSFPGGAAAVTAMYARIALDNRLSLAKPPNPTPSGPSDASYVAHTRPLLVGSGATRLRGAQLRTVTIYQWAREGADEWRRTAEADGFLSRVRFHCDEIARSATAWSTCRSDWTRANQLWRDAAAAEPATDLPLQVTTSLDDVAWARANGFAEFVDRIAVLIPVINRVHPKSMPAFPGRRAEFDPWASGTTPGGAQRRLWSYTSCMSMGCSPNGPDLETEWRGWPSYGIDQPAAQARAMGWISWLYELDGEYYYETARDLDTAWSTLWSADGGNHGDGTLFYPGTVARIGGTHDVPLESMRLKRLRDGREDHEWLLLAARAIGRPETASIAHSTFASAHVTDVAQARIDEARAQLAAVITARTTRELGGDDATTSPGTTAPPRATAPGATPRPGSARRATCFGRRVTILGTGRADVLRGTPRVDVIAGLGGNDRIVGLGRGDFICAGPGDDVVVASSDRGARDLVSCGSGRDRLLHDRRDRARPGCERRIRRG